MSVFKELTKFEILEELLVGEVGIEGKGIVDGTEALKAPTHCFGREYTPDNTCEMLCTAVGIFRGETVNVKDVCRAICSGTKVVSDRAAKYYRPGSGSYYIVKALFILGESTKPEVNTKARQLALIDGNEDKVDEKGDRAMRTLSELLHSEPQQVYKTGHGDEAVYMLVEE